MTTKPLKKGSFETANGEFESCFADGLDISEFLNTSAKEGKPQPSAAEQLLRIKAIEKKEREEEEAQEQRLELSIEKRASNIAKSLEKEKRGPASIVVDALVKMHGHDTAEPSYRGKKKFGKKKSLVTKKSRRIKY